MAFAILNTAVLLFHLVLLEQILQVRQRGANLLRKAIRICDFAALLAGDVEEDQVFSSDDIAHSVAIV